MAVLQGIEQFEAKLAQLERVVRAKLLRVALKEAVEPTRELAASMAPVRTGNLREHEIISVVQSQSTANVAVVRVGPAREAFYGLFEELGTAHQAPDPFLQPAFDQTQAEVLAQVAEAFKEAVDSI